MDFEPSARTKELQGRLTAFMDAHVYPNEARYQREVAESEQPHLQNTPVILELMAEARRQGFWNLFLPDRERGAGLTNLEYAPLAEILGRSIEIAPLVTNCAAPDTGNMEILHLFGTPEQQRQWLEPLLTGEIRSCFAMTEPQVASSDAANLASTITRDGDSYVVHGRKWWTSGADRPNCKIAIFYGVSNPDGDRHHRHSMILVPLDTPGVRIVRTMPVFGYDKPVSHAEVDFDHVRVPAANLLGEEGGGFAISQARLGPGRIHHCMRALGLGERAFDLMCRRALSRTTFGKRLADQGVIQNWIAESRFDLEAARLLVLKTAWLMDTVGNREAAVEISAIKIGIPTLVERILDRAIQVHGGAGLSEDTFLAWAWAHVRHLRIADGPDEVHKMALARRELRRYAEAG